MSLTIGTPSGARTVTALHVGAASGTKTVIEGWVGTASGNKQFYGSTSSPLMVTVTPSSLSWIGGGGSYSSSSDAEAVASGGTAPYVYSWSVDIGSASAIDPESAVTGFFSTDAAGAYASCTVTDALGQSSTSNFVSIT